MLSQHDRFGVRTWIEIDTQAIAHNVEVFRSLVPESTQLMAVVKSNAYGHGLVDFSKTVDALAIDWFAVDSIVEAIRLRKEGIKKPMLVLGYTLPERLQEAIDLHISVTASSMYMLESLVSLKLTGKIKVHVKVDSGMHRQGFLANERESIISFLTANAAATGATLLFPNTHFDIVRIGIGLHGIWPSQEVGVFAEKNISLKPSLSWKTIISEWKVIPKGDRVGYDFTEETIRETKMAVCPIGYWHGFPRSLSSMGEVLVNGVACKVLGRVSMDMIVIDITDAGEVAVGDEVVIIGTSGSRIQTADAIAQKAQNSTYEFITRINPLIKKYYI